MADGRKVKDKMREEWAKLMGKKEPESIIIKKWNEKLLDQLFKNTFTEEMEREFESWLKEPSPLDQPIKYSSTMPSSAMPMPTSMSSASTFMVTWPSSLDVTRFLAPPEPFRPPPNPEPRQRKPTKKEVDELAKNRREDGRLKRVLDLEEDKPQ